MCNTAWSSQWDVHEDFGALVRGRMDLDIPPDVRDTLLDADQPEPVAGPCARRSRVGKEADAVVPHAAGDAGPRPIEANPNVLRPGMPDRVADRLLAGAVERGLD